MSLRKPVAPNIEVDMVPLIDIITLLLMFLVLVGSMEGASQAVKVHLPRADQALPDIVRREGRITVSLHEMNGRYYAVCGSAKSFELAKQGIGGLQSLSDWLLKSAEWQNRKGLCMMHDDGTFDIPVKLRIGEDVPMVAVEAAVDAISCARMRDVHYAARLKE